MPNLLDFVSSVSRVGESHNIWKKELWFVNAGTGHFTELSSNRISFTGTLTYLGQAQPFNFRVELRNNGSCMWQWGEERHESSGQCPYQIINNQFILPLASQQIEGQIVRHSFCISRYNGELETKVTITNTFRDIFGERTEDTYVYHLQPL